MRPRHIRANGHKWFSLLVFHGGELKTSQTHFSQGRNLTDAQQSRLSLFSTKHNDLILFLLDKERTERRYANSMVSAIESFFMFPLSLCEALRSMVFTLKLLFAAKKRIKSKLVQIKIIVWRVRCPFRFSSFHVLPMSSTFFFFSFPFHMKITQLIPVKASFRSHNGRALLFGNFCFFRRLQSSKQTKQSTE